MKTQVKQSSSIMHCRLAATATMVMIAGLTQAATFTWDGAPDGGGVSANSHWSTGDNWVGDVAPANPTSDVVQFREAGTGATNTLDGNWQIGALQYSKQTDNGNAISHATDLGGKTLRVDGPVDVNLRLNAGQDNHGSVTVTMTNGVFQIGTAASPQNLLLANPQTRDFSATLKLGAGSTFEAYINNLSIPAGSSRSSVGILDLRETTIANGTLQINNLSLQSGGRTAWNYTRNAYLQVSDSSNLQNLVVTGNFHMVTNIHAGNNIANRARLGDPNNGYALPAGTNVTIGVSSAEPGAMVLAQGAQMGSGNALLLASAGGDFVGYLSQLDVGVSTRSFIRAVPINMLS